jgi:hypothetical protein
MKHISFESIDCENLRYVKEGKCWICLNLFIELGECVDICVVCQQKRHERENMQTRANIHG